MNNNQILCKHCDQPLRRGEAWGIARKRDLEAYHLSCQQDLIDTGGLAKRWGLPVLITERPQKSKFREVLREFFFLIGFVIVYLVVRSLLLGEPELNIENLTSPTALYGYGFILAVILIGLAIRSWVFFRRYERNLSNWNAVEARLLGPET